jgi:beta-1,4-N-acetylglucosaminyltransferase
MIFVTIGTHNIGFERLLRKMDEIAKDLPEDVIMQIGSSTYIPQNTKYFDFVDEEGMIDHIQKARVIVTHAGAGTILTILTHGKKMILVPRAQKFGECFDDQQLEISKLLEESGEAIAVYDLDNLQSAIKNADQISLKQKIGDKRLVQFLKKTLTGMNL